MVLAAGALVVETRWGLFWAKFPRSPIGGETRPNHPVTNTSGGSQNPVSKPLATSIPPRNQKFIHLFRYATSPRVSSINNPIPTAVFLSWNHDSPAYRHRYPLAG